MEHPIQVLWCNVLIFKTFFFFFFFKEGRMHDARMLAVSDLYDDLTDLLSVQLEEKCVYMRSISKPNWGFNQANGNF